MASTRVGDFRPYRSQAFQNLLCERFRGLSELLLDLHPEIPSCAEGGAQPSGAKKAREEIQHKESSGPQDPPLEILYVGLFAVF